MNDLDGEQGGDAGPDVARGTSFRGIEAVEAAVDAILPLGALVSYLIGQMPGVQEHKVRDTLARLLLYASTNVTELFEKVDDDPNLRRLIWEVGRAAADTELEAKIDGLARVGSVGVLDDARIDEARYLVRALSQIEALHYRALRLLPERVGDDESQFVDLAETLGTGLPLAEAIATDLVRLALAETPGMSFRGITTRLYLAPFGAEVLAYLSLRAAGGGEE